MAESFAFLQVMRLKSAGSVPIVIIFRRWKAQPTTQGLTFERTMDFLKEIEEVVEEDHSPKTIAEQVTNMADKAMVTNFQAEHFRYLLVR